MVQNQFSNEHSKSLRDKSFFFIHIKKKFVRIDTASIQYILSLAHHVKLYTDQGVYIPYLSLRQFEEYLPPEQFCRVNRGAMVALKHITSFTKDEVFLRDDSFILTDTGRKELEEKITVLLHEE